MECKDCIAQGNICETEVQDNLCHVFLRNLDNQKKFTIDEFKNYLKNQDSLGDIYYNLSVENVLKANKKEKGNE